MDHGIFHCCEKAEAELALESHVFCVLYSLGKGFARLFGQWQLMLRHFLVGCPGVKWTSSLSLEFIWLFVLDADLVFRQTDRSLASYSD